PSAATEKFASAASPLVPYGSQPRAAETAALTDWKHRVFGSPVMTARRPTVQSISRMIEPLEHRVFLAADTPPVFAPENFQAEALNQRQVRLTWVDTSVNELNFLIERSTD